MEDFFTQETSFISGSGDAVRFECIAERVATFLVGCDDYTIEVGTDSQTSDVTKYVTAIVVHKRGRGGIFFYFTLACKRMPHLRDRIYMETSLSIGCAVELLESFLDCGMMYDISIHCDVGPNGRTRELIREITGYVTASGFDCKVKPEGTTACMVADRFSK